MGSALVPKILRTTFNGIKSSADMALNGQIRQTVISVPNHIDDDMRVTIERAAKLAGYSPPISDLEDPSLKHTDAVGLAYSLDVPEALGRISILVDYNEGSLELWIVNNGMVGKPKGHIIFPELGVLAIVDEAVDTYFLTVQRRIENSLRKHLVDGDGKPVGLRAVVLAGDASERGMDGMKDVLVMVLEGLGYEGALGLVKDSVDTLYVGAVGAAMRGKDMVREPERFARKASGGHGEL